MAIAALVGFSLMLPIHAQTITELDIEVVFASEGTTFSEGYIIASPRFTSIQTYPMVMDHEGTLLHNELHPMRGFNFDQHPDGRLSWYWTEGGAFEVLDSSMQASEVHTFIGADVDFHDFELLPDGGAMLLGGEISVANVLDSVPDPSDPFRSILDCMIQIQDSAGNIDWFWRASDHVPPTWCTHCNWNASLLDVYHHNAFQTLPDGDVLLCLRNMDAVVRIDRPTGTLDWVLGGPFSDFNFATPEAVFKHPHDAQLIGDDRLILFDNGTGKDPEICRAAEYQIDEETGVVTLLQEWVHPDGSFASSQGSVQRLVDGGLLVGWGTGASDAYGGGMITEFDAVGNARGSVFFPVNHFNYRARKVAPGALPLIQGCRDPEACNFNPSAVLEGDCVQSGAPCDDGDPCTVLDVIESDCQCVGVLPPVDSPIGCSDPYALNFDPCAYPDIDDGTCQYGVSFRVDATALSGLPASMELHIDGNVLPLEAGGFGTWTGELVLGNAEWEFSYAADGQLEPIVRTLDLGWPLPAPLSEQRACHGLEAEACPGCTDPDDAAFSPFAVDESLCGPGPWVGCTAPEAVNFNPAAIFDDGSCQIDGVETCPQDMDGDGQIGISDILIVLTYFGMSCGN